MGYEMTHIYTLASLGIAFFAFFVGALVLKRDTQKVSNIFFFVMAVASGAWIGASAAYSGNMFLTESLAYALSFSYLFASTASIAFLFFALTFTRHRVRISNLRLLGIIAPYMVFAWTLLFYPAVIAVPNDVGGRSFGFLYIPFTISNAGYVMAAAYLLVERYRASAGVFKTVTRSIVTAVIICSALFFASAAMLYLGCGEFCRLAQYLVILYAMFFVGLKIIEYNRWRAKPFLTELFVIAVTLVLATQMSFVSSILDAAMNCIALTLFIISGYFLVKNVEREAHAKDEIEKLVKDLTEANEQLQLLDARKSEFVRISAHHLKSPLTAIKGYASMILEGSFNKDVGREALEAVQKMFDASERLVGIIKDFMDITNIESGKMEYMFETVDLKKLVEGTIEEMGVTIKRSGLEVTFGTDDLPAYDIVADPGKLRQVISNLVDNAIKYTPQGHVRLFLKKGADEGTFHLTIADTGVGMSRETIEKLFEKFSRADDANKVNTGGSGLGLYVAREIMKKHNARIWAESPGEGKGSIFHLVFSGTVK